MKLIAVEAAAGVPALLIFGSLRIFGQATNLDPGLVSLIGNLGIMGILVWHLWYHTTNSYPNMIAKFSKENEELRKAFAEEQAKQRAAEKDNQASLAAERQREREEDAKEKADLRQMLFETMRSMRVAVHDVKDTAQTVVAKADQAIETAKRHG